MTAQISVGRKVELGDRLNNLRGVVMTCYAQVEFALTDVALRCSHLECYQGLVPKFPRKMADKIKAARRYAAAAGPMSPFRQELDIAIDHINQFTELRDLMGHAKAHIDISPSNHIVYFEMYRIVEGGRIQFIRNSSDLDKIANDVDRLVLYTHTMIDLFARMYVGLPPRLSTDGPIPEI